MPSEADGPHVRAKLEELAKYTSYMYRVLPEEQKKAWEKYAARDKLRYETELASYTPPDGYSKTGLLILGQPKEEEKDVKNAIVPIAHVLAPPVARADEEVQEEAFDAHEGSAMRKSDEANDQQEVYLEHRPLTHVERKTLWKYKST